MLEIILSAEAETRLKAAFSEFEGSENVFFRIHEVKVGST